MNAAQLNQKALEALEQMLKVRGGQINITASGPGSRAALVSQNLETFKSSEKGSCTLVNVQELKQNPFVKVGRAYNGQWLMDIEHNIVAPYMTGSGTLRMRNPTSGNVYKIVYCQNYYGQPDGKLLVDGQVFECN